MDNRMNRDTVRDRNLDDQAPRVAALSDLDDFQVAEGYPDPRGWDVTLAGGDKVGEVHDLIVDTRVMRTRYLDLRLDKDAIGTDKDRDVLVPVGAAQLDENDDHVLLGSLTAAQLAGMPMYDHGTISRQYEDSVLARMPVAGTAGVAATGAAATAGADYYDSPHFDDKSFFAPRDARKTDDKERLTRSEEELEVGKRQIKGGEVDVHKTVETEHVSKPVTLRHDEVTIERRPINADTADMNARKIGDDEIRIPLTAEEAVVDKRAVVKEEVVIRKHAVSENKTVEADLRKEKIDIDRNTDRNTDRGTDASRR